MQKQYLYCKVILHYDSKTHFVVKLGDIACFSFFYQIKHVFFWFLAVSKMKDSFNRKYLSQLTACSMSLLLFSHFFFYLHRATFFVQAKSATQHHLFKISSSARLIRANCLLCDDTLLINLIVP